MPVSQLVFFGLLLTATLISANMESVVVNYKTYKKFTAFNRAEKLIKDVKLKTNLWTPGHNKFSSYDIERMKSVLGAIPPLPSQSDDTKTLSSPVQANLPVNFDARKKWTHCPFTIRNQGGCGDCWNFAGTSVVSDRFCIKKGIKTLLSTEQNICNNQNNGCNGGFYTAVFNKGQSSGLVTEACFPYTSGTYPPPSTQPPCPAKCKNGTPMSRAQKFYTTGSIPVGPSLNPDINAIKTEVFNNGPVAIFMEVYEDFMHYKSGIYHHVSGGQVGGHAMRVVGWGIESGVHYWLILNQWGTGWGENGAVRVKMGDSQVCTYAYTTEPR